MQSIPQQNHQHVISLCSTKHVLSESFWVVGTAKLVKMIYIWSVVAALWGHPLTWFWLIAGFCQGFGISLTQWQRALSLTYLICTTSSMVLPLLDLHWLIFQHGFRHRMSHVYWQRFWHSLHTVGYQRRRLLTTGWSIGHPSLFASCMLSRFPSFLFCISQVHKHTLIYIRKSLLFIHFYVWKHVLDTVKHYEYYIFLL